MRLLSLPVVQPMNAKSLLDMINTIADLGIVITYDPCYYNNPCGHWGCGNVCTRYSNCVPCQNYRTTFRVGGYNCLATPKTGDVSVIGMALISLAGAGAAIMGKKRK